ncbi:F-box domain containing protein, partial [Trema orientale]
MDQLPDHVVLTIFSKLQAKTLLGLRCICKLWSQIIDGRLNGPYEAEMHVHGGAEDPR